MVAHKAAREVAGVRKPEGGGATCAHGLKSSPSAMARNAVLRVSVLLACLGEYRPPCARNTHTHTPPTHTLYELQHVCYSCVWSEIRVKRQEEDAGGDDVNPEELCDGRPADEYFRLTTEGDCRDVVRSGHRFTNTHRAADTFGPFEPLRSILGFLGLNSNCR
ncbi:hypothetical protein EVAR_12098_1 [Eumeta japonica]|uniref:Uncharacterized protein n=1 Tax=Eumeta variegata TaxID=151549 RepID=A0A4C1U5U3_EUMVA|nr:hypothetical protein EVAR_12098_1 [Eumeta japonica]